MEGGVLFFHSILSRVVVNSVCLDGVLRETIWMGGMDLGRVLDFVSFPGFFVGYMPCLFRNEPLCLSFGGAS
jgi:hypothetical protein